MSRLNQSLNSLNRKLIDNDFFNPQLISFTVVLFFLCVFYKTIIKLYQFERNKISLFTRNESFDKNRHGTSKINWKTESDAGNMYLRGDSEVPPRPGSDKKLFLYFFEFKVRNMMLRGCIEKSNKTPRRVLFALDYEWVESPWLQISLRLQINSGNPWRKHRTKRKSVFIVDEDQREREQNRIRRSIDGAGEGKSRIR